VCTLRKGALEGEGAELVSKRERNEEGKRVEEGPSTEKGSNLRSGVKKKKEEKALEAADIGRLASPCEKADLHHGGVMQGGGVAGHQPVHNGKRRGGGGSGN